jgi:hypothetical protein
MRVLVSRRAARLLLALVLLAPLGVWTAARGPAGAGRAEQVAARALPAGEQVVQADRQPLLRGTLDRRGDPGGARLVLLAIFAAATPPGLVRRRWGRRGRTIQRPRGGAAPACASRAPPRLLSA